MAITPVSVRILRRTVRDGDCLVWTGHRSNEGYGSISWNGKRWLVHRAIWTEVNGPIPDGLKLDHVKARGCRSTACVNLDHLEPVTQRENIARGSSPAANAIRTDRCAHGHDLTGDNVATDTDGSRLCRACKRRKWSDWYTRSGRRRPRELKPCGTPAGYERHRRRGESCAECRTAKAAAVSAQLARRKLEAVDG